MSSPLRTLERSICRARGVAFRPRGPRSTWPALRGGRDDTVLSIGGRELRRKARSGDFLSGAATFLATILAASFVGRRRTPRKVG